MIKLIQLIESLTDWKGRWVHFTNVPYLKLNPKQFHTDVIGIYLFPETFKPHDHWLEMKYKFTVEIPSNLRVLDLATMSKEDCVNLLIKLQLDAKRGFDDTVNLIKKVGQEGSYYHQPADPMWEFLKEVYSTSYAKWNGDFRRIGYDAIFDDTNSIHIREVQLIILDPTKLKVLSMEQRSGTGYKDVLRVMNRILQMIKKYHGHVEVRKPIKKTRKSWYSEDLEGSITLSNKIRDNYGDDDYREISFKVYPRKYESGSSGRLPPREIGVYIRSTPARSYGVGATYNVFEPDDWSDIDKLSTEIDWVMNSKSKYND